MTETMKPLVRWTIGQVHALGFRTLKEAVNSFTNIYTDTFDYVIAHNSLDESQVNEIASLGVPLHNVSYNNEIKYPPSDSKWKLYPPRMRMDTHEIILDNDILWFKKLPEIDEFLADSKFLVCDGRKRNLGKFDQYVPKGMRLNSGIVGYPPGFDLQQAISDVLSRESGNFWRHWNDDQGVLATIILNTNNYIQISQASVSISYPEYNPSQFATHFCGINKGHDKAYNQYTNYGCLML
jgi:hypothetical protein